MIVSVTPDSECLALCYCFDNYVNELLYLPLRVYGYDF